MLPKGAKVLSGEDLTSARTKTDQAHVPIADHVNLPKLIREASSAVQGSILLAFSYQANRKFGYSSVEAALRNQVAVGGQRIQNPQILGEQLKNVAAEIGCDLNSQILRQALPEACDHLRSIKDSCEDIVTYCTALTLSAKFKAKSSDANYELLQELGPESLDRAADSSVKRRSAYFKPSLELQSLDATLKHLQTLVDKLPDMKQKTLEDFLGWCNDEELRKAEERKAAEKKALEEGEAVEKIQP
jgi:paraquat-inducible protein B